MIEWPEFKTIVAKKFLDKKLPEEYRARLAFEFKEIEKQGANGFWQESYDAKKTWDKNPNGLVLPWILGMTPVDPIASNIKHNIQYQTDYPDVDIDFLPHARSTIKEHAIKTYGHVCSVGSWVTFQPRSAIQAVTRAYGGDLRAAIQLTKNLPDEFDDENLEKLMDYKKDAESHADPKVRQEAHMEVNKYQAFYDFYALHPGIVKLAFRLVGKIIAQGTHAGGVIIADRAIENIVPLSYMGKKNAKQWTSQWTEGNTPQLSKFGLVKYDILGLKTMYYIWQAGNLIKDGLGITIDWDRMDPTHNPPYAGFEIMPDRTEQMILQNDPVALKMCNDLRTDSVFQIETTFQKGIISEGKVKDFWDLVVYNALGRPGPMDMIPKYIERRDGRVNWRDGVDKRITDILEETYNVIVYQEQLQTMWIRLAGFTVPESEAARKVIAKKWADKLPKVEAQWMKGATKTIGEAEAKRWWDMMVTFGRYAFNRAHSVAYSILTYRCLYLKSHYPAQWWAAAMTECKQDKLKAYMSAARLDGVRLGNIDINALSEDFTVKDGKVIPGLKSVKGIGKKAAYGLSHIGREIESDQKASGLWENLLPEEVDSEDKEDVISELGDKTFITGTHPNFRNIDEVVEKFGKKKNIFERLIKLGAFDNLHPNRKALWMWYQYKYCASDPELSKMRQSVNARFGGTVEDIEKERARKREEFRKLYPKRKKIPKAIENWKPKVGHNCDIPTRSQVMSCFDDYTDEEKLKIEKELLGYYWNSPLLMYEHEGLSIEGAKTKGVMEVVIEEITSKKAKATGNTFYIYKVTDGIQVTDVTVWADVHNTVDSAIIRPGSGIKLEVLYSKEHANFRIKGRTEIIPLYRKGTRPVIKDEYALI